MTDTICTQRPQRRILSTAILAKKRKGRGPFFSR